jgi:hypothetical protein
VADPENVPRYPTGQIDQGTWAELGTATEPVSGKQDTGYTPGNVVTSAELNWLIQNGFRFDRASFSRMPVASELFFGSWFPPVDCGIWQDAVNPLDVYLTDSGGVDSIVADVWVDPISVSTGAVRVQVNVPLGDPQTLVANRDTYVYVPAAMLVPPLVSRAEVTFLNVPINDPQPATPAGTVPVWRIETNGVGIVNQEILLQDMPILKQVGLDVLFANDLTIGDDLQIGDDLNVGGDVDIAGGLLVGADINVTGGVFADTILAYTGLYSGGDINAAYGELYVGLDGTFGGLLSALDIVATDSLSVDGNVDLGVGAGAKTITVGADSADTFTTAATATLASNVNLCTGTGNFTCTVGSAALDTFTCNATATFNAPVTVANGQAFTANGNTVLGNAIGDTITITGTVSANVAMGAHTITGAAGSGVNVTTVTCTDLQLVSDGSPSTTTGVVSFGGRYITAGLSSVARILSIPLDSYVAGPVATGLAIADTGASITVVLVTGDKVIVEMSLESSQSNIANDINVRIEANGAAIGGTNPYRGVVNNVIISPRRVVEFTAVASIAYTFTARHGASATTTTSSNIHLTVRFSN